MKIDIKIQSITDVITNSSSSVYTIYYQSDKNTIKHIFNTILSLNSDLTFDDLFEIKMQLDYDSVEYFYNHSEYDKIFKDIDDFINYLESLTDEDLYKYEREFIELTCHYDYPPVFYDGFKITIKPGIEKTEKLEKIIRVLEDLDIFEHENYYN